MLNQEDHTQTTSFIRRQSSIFGKTLAFERRSSLFGKTLTNERQSILKLMSPTEAKNTRIIRKILKVIEMLMLKRLKTSAIASKTNELEEYHQTLQQKIEGDSLKDILVPKVRMRLLEKILEKIENLKKIFTIKIQIQQESETNLQQINQFYKKISKEFKTNGLNYIQEEHKVKKRQDSE